MQPFSVYLHIPFCHHRCSYCDFNTYSGLENLIPDYTQALCSEIKFTAANFEQRVPVHTVFFGGGTPSLLPISTFANVFEALNHEFEIINDAEITLEANPERVNSDYLKGLRSLGINRLSLGMQTTNPEELRLLERQHDYDQIALTVNLARKAGFDNVNLDLIFGLPHQTLESWKESLELGLNLNPDHFSLYALTVEEGTPIADWIYKGLLIEPDPDLAADMYELASERLDKSGFKQYEISNWAKFGESNGLKSCQHNLQYWRNLPYLGLGAGAHGYGGGIRTANVLSPKRYIQSFLSDNVNHSQYHLQFPSTPATVDSHYVKQDQEIRETMMMGLRLTEEGVSGEAFRARFGTSLREVYETEIEELISEGLLEWEPVESDRLRLTPRGRLLGNQVFVRFI
jgi:oxygen-independent coproporphyrinogen-3 oxidase